MHILRGMPEETWVDIAGWDGYQVSNLGRVQSRKSRGKDGGWAIICGYLTPRGYTRVKLRDESGRQRKLFLQRIVAEAFLGPQPTSNHVVRHLDSNPSNNRADNLCWGTHSENQKDRFPHIWTPEGRVSKRKNFAIRREILENHPPVLSDDEIQRMEEWRTVPGFDGYRVSSLGRVQSCLAKSDGRKYAPDPSRWKNLKPSRTPNGYLKQTIFDGDRRSRCLAIHAIVLLAFIGPRPKGMVCRHLDNNRMNNRLGNLAYGTPAENYQDQLAHGTAPVGERHYASRLTKDQVLEIRRLCDEGATRASVAKRFGVSETNISAIHRRKRWQHA